MAFDSPSPIMVKPSPIAQETHSASDYPSHRHSFLLLVSLFLISAFAQIDRVLPFILLESIKADLSLSDTQVGLLTGVAFAVCYALLSLPFAYLSDRGSPRAILVLCTLVWSVMTAMGGLAASFMLLAMTRFGVAIGEAGAEPSGHALIARKVSPMHRGVAIGVFSMGMPIGTMAGFGLGGAINDMFGWRAALMGAGMMGCLIGIFALLAIGPTPPRRPQRGADTQSFVGASMQLLASPPFRWLVVGAVTLGFAATPFYAFATPFLIRTHGYSASEAGLAFGVLQGISGVAGTLLGGRGFDRVARHKSSAMLAAPAILFIIAAVTTTMALFVPVGWLCIVLLLPAMFAFAFTLPYAFGSAHLVAGRGREAMASSLGMIGSSLIGPAIGPLLVGVISDAASAAHVANGLGLGLLVVPVATMLTATAYLIANRRIHDWFQASVVSEHRHG